MDAFYRLSWFSAPKILYRKRMDFLVLVSKYFMEPMSGRIPLS